MSETKHTPGPWRLTEETYFHASRKGGTTMNTMPLIPVANTDDAFTNEVALVWKSSAHAKRDIANARLIAAAPTLLAAAKAAAEAMGDIYDGAPDSPTLSLGKPMDDLRAAIRDAEGAAS